jgi:hypothetical protein
MLVQTVRRWGRHAITLQQAIALDELYLVKLGYGREDHRYEAKRLEANVEMFTEYDKSISVTDAGPLYGEMLRARYDEARRRLCYREMTALVFALVRTNLVPETLIQIARFALPCFDEQLVRRIDITRIIDRVRTAAAQSEDTAAGRSVERRIQ